MPFDSNTARLAGQKSKRGKDKLTYELKQKLSLLADGIVSSLISMKVIWKKQKVFTSKQSKCILQFQMLKK